MSELRADGQVLSPGVYTRSEFEPSIHLELDGSWQAVQMATGFFDVQKEVGSPDVIAVQFANVTGVVGAEGVVPPESAEEAAEIIRQNPNLTVVESSASRMGGLVGFQITIEYQGEEHAQVLETPPGILGIDPERRLWIAFFDTEPGVLAVMVGGSVAEWERALAEAEPVLESVVIGS